MPISTLFGLLQTVSVGEARISAEIADLRADLDSKLAGIDAKLDKILTEVAPPPEAETGDFNPSSAVLKGP
jgi:hypothetical protein